MQILRLLMKVNTKGDERQRGTRAEPPAGRRTTPRRRGRREILGLGTAAGVSALAAALLPLGSAEAGHGPGGGENALHLGETNDATLLPATRIESRAPRDGLDGAFTVVSDDPESGDPADAAIFAFSANSRGIRGESVNRQGVLGVSTNFAGVGALSRTTYGVIGNGQVKAGVLGYVPHGPFPTTPDGTGVHGAGPVLGVLGTSDGGTAVRAQSPNGTALQVIGPAHFSTAGLATIPQNAESVVVTPGIDIAEDSKVLVTLQSDPGGKAAIQHVDRDPVNDTFTIKLTKPAPVACAVAWFVIS